ncbi:gas vesicle protein GvpG [Streptomyces sp. NPDC012888]|uniref:gas vesicle protein GvpG n=1 Tax=Streptomyces sp. NPDC012888 TaxID=3364855 RepID=UPI003684BCAE
MGLLGKLITAPLMPVRGVVWVAQRVAERAEAEYYDPAPVFAELAGLERRLAEGEIDEETFDREEDRLLERLEEIERYRRGELAPGPAPDLAPEPAADPGLPSDDPPDGGEQR